MKVKDLDFGFIGQASISFVNPIKAANFADLLIEKRSKRSFYVFAKRLLSEFPCAYYRVSFNANVEDVFYKVINS